MSDHLACTISRHGRPQWTPTAVPRLTVISVERPQPAVHHVYDPMVCFIAQGAKVIDTSGRRWVAGPGQMFLNLFDMPGTVELPQAPYRSAVMRLDPQVLADLLLEFEDARPPAASPAPGGQLLAPMHLPLMDAVSRWTALLDTPEDIPPLAGRIEAEIVYRLLQSPLAAHLRQYALSGSVQARIAAVTSWLRDHYQEAVTIDSLCDLARTSAATLHRQFKAATGMSPLQFHQRIRLQQARHLLVSTDTTVTAAAHAVGYASPSQFSREYRRVYGCPPGRETVRLREQLS
ncbi:AraC family transcriptional regulator N-terminal domain-containing protein [Streptomyces sp. NPDC001255]|uniref:AraC family transcriptional regulator n=1 Tax=Streptomyces sp. NPDC001255 TaxID=3364550 RepID=UPI003687C668